MKRRVEVVNATKGTVLGTRVAVADRWWERLKGLLGAPGIAAGEGLVLTPCRSVHMYGMRFALDVALVDAAGRVVALYPHLEPGNRTRLHREAASAVELPSGTLERSRTGLGDRLEWRAGTSGR